MAPWGKRRRGALLVLALAGGSCLGQASPVGAAPTTEVFELTGGEQTFVVPAGVCEITVEAIGASGGDGSPGLTQAPFAPGCRWARRHGRGNHDGDAG